MAQPQDGDDLRRRPYQIGAAAVKCLSISVMHYADMQAAAITEGTDCLSDDALGGSGLAVTVGLVSSLLQAATLAGFPSREGHSGGYWGWIGDRLHPQFPDTPSHAFSDEPFELDNNHGRFFGPYRHEGRLIFVGALSRERVAPLSTPRHQYASFNRGRDQFADAMDTHSAYRRTAFLNLDNAIVGAADVGTGDHDGVAAVLTRQP